MSVELPRSSLKRAHDSNEKFVIEDNVGSVPPCFSPKVYKDTIVNSNSYSDHQSTKVPPFCSSPHTLEVSIEILSPPRPKKKAKISSPDNVIHQVNKGKGDVQRAEEKAQKEKEREIERARKEVERETKRIVHEAEKQAREEKRRKLEEERKKKEEERQRKERSQMKIGSFFGRPQVADKARENNSGKRKGDANSSQISSSVSTPIPEKTPYQILFPEFFKQTGVILAPTGWWGSDRDSQQQTEERLDGYLRGEFTLDKLPTIQEALHKSKYQRLPRGKRHRSVRDIMEEFYLGKSNQSQDYQKSSSSFRAQQSTDLLQSIPVKSLKFQEDVRPPYIGTFTSQPICGIAKLARNPLRKTLPHTDYDYDSEAEWVEDEDGEDLKSNDEDEDSDDDEDMNGFLDDEDDNMPHTNRRIINGDLNPISTGLCWEGDTKHNKNASMAAYRMEIILDPNIKSIDPFSTSYWVAEHSEMVQAKPNLTTDKPLNSDASILLPLNLGRPAILNSSSASVSSNSQLLLFAQPNTSIKSKDKDAPAKRFLAPEDIEEFKVAVAGSDLSKVGLIEVLKKKFPGRPAAAIRATLENIAKRGEKGQKEVDKRWTLL